MFYKDGIQNDTLAANLVPGGPAVVDEWEIDCFDGQTLSCDSVANLTIEAKHDLSGAYTNIETTPIDLSSFAGNRETFQLRFTPSSTNGAFAFRFRVGPIIVVPVYSIVYNDSENEVYNDSENLVYTEIA